MGIDEALAHGAAGHGPLVVLLAAFALGLRHATDPDHLVAVSTLVAVTRERAGLAAAKLGAAWGVGHAVTLAVFGAPMIVFQSFLPERIEALAEALIGAIIALLAVRLLIRWRRGAFHLHAHEHGGGRHLHVHSHHRDAGHEHGHAVRTPTQAFAIGVAHGMAGSGGVAVLLVAAVPTRALAVVALGILVLGTAISMTLLSAAAGRLLAAADRRPRLNVAIPALGSLACAFGAWYTVGALQTLY